MWSEWLLSGAALVYMVTVLLLMLFMGSFGVLLIIYARTRHRTIPLPRVAEDDLPTVTLQLPVFNEAHVIARLIDACAQQDYPPHKFCIQVLDDSTDETTAIIQQKIDSWATRDVHNIHLLRRPERIGYKAGALAYGLAHVDTACIAVFDADFVPPRDFLRRTMPYFNRQPNLALVQTRWDHLNVAYNWLTRAQALTVDGHFAVEQVARNRGRFPMSMNGTGGVWRVSALKDAGGWSADTLTEDLDLSYRALMHGWEFLYLDAVAVPGELPPQVQAYKLQQKRWATGMTECLVKHAVPLLRSRRYAWGQKLMGLAHLSQYAVQPLMLLIFLLTPLLLWGDMFGRLPNLGLCGVVGIIPPVIMITAQRALYADWQHRLCYFPVQMVVGIALVLNNTLGALTALHRPGVSREFKRTPKFSLTRQHQSWSASRYALTIDAITWGEIALGGYAVLGVGLALRHFPAMAPYVVLYACSFFSFAFWNIYQAVSIKRSRGA